MNWSPLDEQRFSIVDAERDELELRRRHAVGKVRECFDNIDMSEGITDAAMAEILRNADAIRDALEPFDSGVRIAEVPA